MRAAGTRSGPRSDLTGTDIIPGNSEAEGKVTNEVPAINQTSGAKEPLMVLKLKSEAYERGLWRNRSI